MKLINQHSFIFNAGGILLVGAVFLLRNVVNLQGVLGVLALAVVLAGVWVVTRSKQSPQDELAEVEELIGGEQPVLLEFQSPY